MADVILLTHSGDRDMDRLEHVLASLGLSCILWRYDARDRDVDVDFAGGSFEMNANGQRLSAEDLRSASVIVHRTGLGPWNTPILSTRGSQAERRFADSEWRALLHSIFLDAEHRYANVTWINRPSVTAVTAHKLQLLTTAELDGLHVGQLRVSTTSALPPSRSGDYVAKAINESEDIDKERTFPTSSLPSDVVSSPRRTDCPSLIQERLYPDHELRVYYLLDALIGLRLVAHPNTYADIRLVPRNAISVDVMTVPPALEGAIRRYVKRYALSYSAFDFLHSPTDGYVLVDVTPSGSWSYFETDSDSFITRWFAQGVARAALRQARSSARGTVVT